MAPEGAARLAATLDIDRAPIAGEALPMLWHWAYFTEPVRRSKLGVDGHAQRGDALARQLPRRMAASGKVTRRAPLLIGRSARRGSELVAVTEKQGRSGPLAFADWRHVIEQDGAVVLEELQTVVYRSAAAAGADNREGPSAPPSADEVTLLREVRFNPTTLFRYSAVTWNSHRIHYDLDYATRVEGYPDLVVHGPLLATLLAGEAMTRLGELGEVEYRARAPVFVNEAVQLLAGEAEGGGLLLEARKLTGVVAMRLRASPAP